MEAYRQITVAFPMPHTHLLPISTNIYLENREKYADDIKRLKERLSENGENIFLISTFGSDEAARKPELLLCSPS